MEECKELAGGRVSGRDVEVLGFLARFGVVPRSAMASWAGTARSMTLRREKRLREAGLLEVSRPWLSSEPVLTATGEGLAVCGRHELAVAKVSPSTLHHFSVVAHLAADLESAGQRLLSERELLAHERAMGERDFSIRLPGGSHHRPDLIAVGEPPTVIEVELSPKGGGRLDQIVAAWAEAVERGRFAGVRYLCSAEARPYVERSIERTEAEAQVDAELLPRECL
jgi:hypothetical protein